MDSVTFSDSRVRETLDREFIPVKINPNDDQVTPAKYKVNGIPAIFITDADGKVLDRAVGFLPPDSFMEFLSKQAKV